VKERLGAAVAQTAQINLLRPCRYTRKGLYQRQLSCLIRNAYWEWALRDPLFFITWTRPLPVSARAWAG